MKNLGELRLPTSGEYQEDATETRTLSELSTGVPVSSKTSRSSSEASTRLPSPLTQSPAPGTASAASREETGARAKAIPGAAGGGSRNIVWAATSRHGMRSPFPSPSLRRAIISSSRSTKRENVAGPLTSTALLNVEQDLALSRPPPDNKVDSKNTQRLSTNAKKMWIFFNDKDHSLAQHSSSNGNNGKAAALLKNSRTSTAASTARSSRLNYNNKLQDLQLDDVDASESASDNENDEVPEQDQNGLYFADLVDYSKVIGSSLSSSFPYYTTLSATPGAEKESEDRRLSSSRNGPTLAASSSVSSSVGSKVTNTRMISSTAAAASTGMIYSTGGASRGPRGFEQQERQLTRAVTPRRKGDLLVEDKSEPDDDEEDYVHGVEEQPLEEPHDNVDTPMNSAREDVVESKSRDDQILLKTSHYYDLLYESNWYSCSRQEACGLINELHDGHEEEEEDAALDQQSLLGSTRSAAPFASSTTRPEIEYRITSNYGWLQLLNLECDPQAEVKAGSFGQAYFFGFMWGALLLPTLADVYGRKRINLVTNFCCIVLVFSLLLVSNCNTSTKSSGGSWATAGNVGSGASRDETTGDAASSTSSSSAELLSTVFFSLNSQTAYTILLTTLFFYGLLIPGHYLVAFVHASELCDGKLRGTASSLIFVCENSDYYICCVWFYSFLKLFDKHPGAAAGVFHPNSSSGSSNGNIGFVHGHGERRSSSSPSPDFYNNGQLGLQFWFLLLASWRVVAFLSVYFLTPESPSYFLTKKEFKSARKVFLEIENVNKNGNSTRPEQGLLVAGSSTSGATRPLDLGSGGERPKRVSSAGRPTGGEEDVDSLPQPRNSFDTTTTSSTTTGPSCGTATFDSTTAQTSSRSSTFIGSTGRADGGEQTKEPSGTTSSSSPIGAARRTEAKAAPLRENLLVDFSSSTCDHPDLSRLQNGAMIAVDVPSTAASASKSTSASSSSAEGTFVEATTSTKEDPGQFQNMSERKQDLVVQEETLNKEEQLAPIMLRSRTGPGGANTGGETETTSAPTSGCTYDGMNGNSGRSNSSFDQVHLPEPGEHKSQAAPRKSRINSEEKPLIGGGTSASSSCQDPPRTARQSLKTLLPHSPVEYTGTTRTGSSASSSSSSKVGALAPSADEQLQHYGIRNSFCSSSSSSSSRVPHEANIPCSVLLSSQHRQQDAAPFDRVIAELGQKDETIAAAGYVFEAEVILAAEHQVKMAEGHQLDHPRTSSTSCPSSGIVPTTSGRESSSPGELPQQEASAPVENENSANIKAASSPSLLTTLNTLDSNTKKQLVVISVLWLTTALVNWSFQFMTPRLPGNLFANFTAIGLGKLIGYGSCGPLADFFGRKTLMIAMYMLNSCCMLLYVCAIDVNIGGEIFHGSGGLLGFLVGDGGNHDRTTEVDGAGRSTTGSGTPSTSTGQRISQQPPRGGGHNAVVTTTVFTIDSLGREEMSGVTTTRISSINYPELITTTSLILFNVIANATAFGVIFIVTGELFPSKIRGTAFAMSNFVGRVGSFLAPQLPEMVSADFPTNVKTENTILLLVVVSFMSGLLMLNIPETKGRQMT
ncbi:unnamed protein product [Amoebophrya sp. A120]|nr:unnamed protein product [Amoebophrya sp. A120]|eukprot:GSA120T00010203001.1